MFEVTTAEADFQRYIGNRQSQTLHIRGANHLPDMADRQPFATEPDALASGYTPCGVCFVPTPDVSDYETERSLAMMSLQQVQSTYSPLVDTELQEYVEGVGERVLDSWPVPLKGYRYRFQVVDSDDVNAFAVPTGYIFMTRGLLQSLESDDEVAAILAHEIAHVESRHSYRIWRNAQRASTIAGIVGIFAGATDNNVDDIVAIMTSFTANLFMAGHGRDREREADLFASFLPYRDGCRRPAAAEFVPQAQVRPRRLMTRLVKGAAGCSRRIPISRSASTGPVRPPRRRFLRKTSSRA